MIALAVQTIFFFDVNNLFCSVIALTSIFSLRYFFREQIVSKYILSAGAGFMHSFAFLMLPLVLSCFEWRPMTQNLHRPIEVFGWHACLTLSIIGAHYYYTRSSGARRSRQWISKNINERVGLFITPKDTHLWIIGFIGMAGMVVMALAFKEKGAVGENGGSGLILVQITSLAYVPFLIPFRSLYAPDQVKPARERYGALGAYFVLILGIAIYRNDRSDFATAIAIAAFCFALGLILGRIKIGRRAANVIGYIALFGAIAGPYLADLAVAMVIVRLQYKKSGARGQMDLTFDVMEHREKIDAFLAAQMQPQAVAWDEHYYAPANVFVTRFANPKIDDNFLTLSTVMSDGNLEKFRDFSRGQFLAKTLPGPLFAILVPADKADYMTGSLGDNMLYYSYGIGLGGFRSGSLLGDGIVVFGPAAILFFPLVMIPFFVVVDSLTKRQKSGQLAISCAALITLFFILDPYVQGMYGAPINFALRGFPMLVITFSLSYYIARKVDGAFGFIGRTSKPRLQNPVRPSLPSPTE